MYKIDRIYEIMGQLNPTIKDKLLNETLNEISPKMAGKVLGNKTWDERGKELLRNSITSIFRDVIGKDLPFYIKTRSDNNPAHYMLIEVHKTNDGDIFKGDMHFDFYFYNKGGSKHEATYVENKKEIILTYSIKEDRYHLKNHNSLLYSYNPYIVNFLIKAASKLRQMFFEAYPVYKEEDKHKTYNKDRSVDVERTEEMKKSHLTKRDFDIFNYDSGNLLNFK